jgi:FKBP-type peptidyl-prolyl cis-trans isomerase
LLVKEVKSGSGQTPKTGDRCIVDWTGYTIGYDGRPFQSKQRKDDESINSFFRFEVGKGDVIPAFEEAVQRMAEGGVLQLVVEQPALGYPQDDPAHDRVGPKPTSFGGQRALNSVLETANRDKTLLFNLKLVRVDKPGQNGWQR